MLRSLLRIALAAVLGLAGPALASQPEPEGVPQFGIDVRFDGKVKVGQPLRLLVAMSGSYVEGTTMEGRIALPEGVELVSGPLRRSVKAGGPEEPWAIVVRPTRKGPQRIVATFAGAVSEQERDEGDFVLTLDADGSADGGISRRTRTEKVVGAQRYRYGGDFLVPIDAPEDFNQNDIQKGGRKAESTARAAATCDRCGKESPAAVSFVVFIDKAGQVADARALGIPATDPAAVAARNALASWKFKPSQIAGRPVADWMVVKIDVNPRR